MKTQISRRDVCLLAGAALAAPLARAGTRWRLATGYGVALFQTANILTLAREVGLATQGGFSIEVVPDGALAKLNEVRPAVEAGRIEAGETIMSSLVGEMPIAGADSVPFIVRSYADAQRLWRHQRPLLERHFARRGMQLLYAVPWPPQGLFTSKAIAGVQDFKGARMRTYNATTARIAALLGAQSVDVPLAGIAQALKEGRVDSMITSAVTGVENQVWQHLKYFYEINAWFPKNVVFANAKALEALQPAEREALMRAAAAAETRGWATSQAVAGESVDTLRRHGVQVERTPAEFARDLKRLGERFSLEWIRQVGAEANEIFIPYFSQA